MIIFKHVSRKALMKPFGIPETSLHRFDDEMLTKKSQIKRHDFKT